MPTSEELLVQIRNQITAYQINVKSDNKAHRYNINDRAESFTVPLFTLLFGWDQLQDLNKHQLNFPGIDLGDYENRIAIQVTSETSFEKVKDTITQFVDSRYYESFDRLVVFMIREKNLSYSQATINSHCQGKFHFDAKHDILDLTDLMQFVKALSVTNLQAVMKLFQAETGFLEKNTLLQVGEAAETSFDAPLEPPFESGLLNLCEIGVPDVVYVGDWNFSKKSLRSKKRNDRKLVQDALEKQKLKFAVDWVTLEKQIFTFHDLSDTAIPLSRIVDQGTVTQLQTDELFDNSFYRNTFVALLQRCLQQKLYKLNIKWQNKEKEYIFGPAHDGDNLREIAWSDIKTGTRTVYRQIMDLKDSTRVYCHEHFAFTTRFYELGNQWFLSLTPDWFYSSDGYARAWYAIEDKRKYKKQVEANQNVSTHVRFLHSYLSSNNPQSTTQISMFDPAAENSSIYKFLWIKNLCDIPHMPRLPDAEWRPPSVSDSSEESENLL